MVKHKAEIAVVVSVIAFFTVPVIPTNHYRSTLRVPPLGSRCQADPSGSYCGETFTNGTAYLNSSTYEKLAHDPYSILCGSGVFDVRWYCLLASFRRHGGSR